MRYALTLVGVSILATACGGHSTHGSSTGVLGTGTGTGGAGTTGGTSGGGEGLPPGATCSSDAVCKSKFCGIDAVDGGVNVDGGSNCCATQCTTDNAVCGALGCDNSGACIYPASGLTCAPSTCSGDKLTVQQCDGFGDCFINQPALCPGHFVCSGNRTDCDTSCKVMADCASGSYCQTDAGKCIPQIDAGPCDNNLACTTGICGLNGTGNCCAVACRNEPAPCGATGCDATTGACVFPGTSVSCGPGGPTSCDPDSGIETNPNVFCTGLGYCESETTGCAPFLCGATACLTKCNDDTSCVSGSAYCNEDAGVDAGVCLDKLQTGPCSSDDACLTGICGIAGVGNCCSQTCTPTAPPCGATGCDPIAGNCNFPDPTVLCGTIAESCSAGIQQNPSACDGAGNCDNAPGTTACTPFICGTNACLLTCTSASDCVSGDICDPGSSSCCTPVASGGAIAVDGAGGNDGACCNLGSCKTVSRAMQLIDASSAKNVTINADLQGGGGNWPAGETYPIVLGWGAELVAPGVYFLDRNGGNQEIIDIAAYSANDTVGYASIVGAAGNNVGIGMSSALNLQTTDQAGVRIENGQTLYIANALVNGSALGTSTALYVEAGGGLVLGEDQPDLITGTVTIGNDGNSLFTDGWDGIYCNTGKTTGCTITDATLTGKSSVMILGQEDVDITALDFASISLTSAPTIGVTPTDHGFGECPPPTGISPGSAKGKPDVAQSKGQAIWLDGKVSMTFSNGTVQCISGTAFKLVTSPNGNGDPSLTLQGSVIQNTERAVYASAGTATISGSTIEFNYNGVEQTGTGTINLSGSDGGANSIVCSSGTESITAVDGGTTATPGVDVLNDTTATLDAVDDAWDTSGPDLFSCNAALTTCTCENKGCANGGGVDDMDAVDDTTGTITTTGATVSSISTAAGCK